MHMFKVMDISYWNHKVILNHFNITKDIWTEGMIVESKDKESKNLKDKVLNFQRSNAVAFH
jgi:hypothetical protein